MTFCLVDVIIILSILISTSLLSVKFRVFTLSGTIAAFFIGLIIFLFGGWCWFALLLFFHFASALITRYRYDVKRSLGAAEMKGGARSWLNVVANGGIAALFALGEGVFGGDIFFAGFLGAISAAAADTLATEIGLLYPGKPRLIVNLSKKVEPGTSGGISPYGEYAIFLTSFVIGLLAAISNVNLNFSSLEIIVLSVISGFFGATADSLFGSTIQGQYYCERCGVLSERPLHSCGYPARHVRGFKVINNHVVNFLSTLVGGGLGFLLAFLL